jgi:hypothetical protein
VEQIVCIAPYNFMQKKKIRGGDLQTLRTGQDINTRRSYVLKKRKTPRKKKKKRKWKTKKYEYFI